MEINISFKSSESNAKSIDLNVRCAVTRSRNETKRYQWFQNAWENLLGILISRNTLNLDGLRFRPESNPQRVTTCRFWFCDLRMAVSMDLVIWINCNGDSEHTHSMPISWSINLYTLHAAIWKRTIWKEFNANLMKHKFVYAACRNLENNNLEGIQCQSHEP